jgi:PilZ domain-containing protein
MEHRWGNRYEVRHSVRVATHSGVVARGRIINVSMSGALVDAALPVALLSYVKVQFNSASDGRPTMVQGQVVRKDSAGIALKWREMSPDLVEALGVRPATSPQERIPRLVFQRAAAASPFGRLPIE